MPKIGAWNSGKRGADYRFFDRTISESFQIGGTAAYLHLYTGPTQQDYAMSNLDGTFTQALPTAENPHPVAGSQPSVTTVQDVLFLENRDRNYSTTVYEMRTIYNVSDSDADLKQFGLFLQGDNLFLEFHYNDMIAQLGRKIISGDVIELPHQRDLDVIPASHPAINKYYVVTDASKGSTGFSATWFHHIWRVKVSPLTGGPEYASLLEQQATNPLGFNQGTIGSLMSTIGNEMGINDAIVAAARANVSKRNFETQQFWIVPGTEGEGGLQNPWVFAGDGIPPNGAVLASSGSSFPSTPVLNDYCLRTDYDPHALFQYSASGWTMQEIDYRQTKWSVAHRLLLEFTNNTNSDTIGGLVVPEKQNLSKAIKPRADF